MRLKNESLQSHRSLSNSQISLKNLILIHVNLSDPTSIHGEALTIFEYLDIIIENSNLDLIISKFDSYFVKINTSTVNKILWRTLFIQMVDSVFKYNQLHNNVFM